VWAATLRLLSVITDPCGHEDGVEWSAPGGDPNSGTGETFTTSWDTAGTHTATASLCDSNDSNDVIVVEVASLEPNEPNDPNVIAEFDDDDGDPNTRSFIICIVDPNHDPNVITVIATPNPDVNEPNLPACWTLTGGTGTGKLLRTVDRTIAAETELIATCGTSSKTTTIYVADVNMDMSGVVDANEENPGGYIALGSDTTTIDLYAVLPTELPFDSNHPMTLDVNCTGAGSIEIWDHGEIPPTKLTLPKDYNSPGDLPASGNLWIKGTATSDSQRDITITWEYTIDSCTVQDKINVTVFDVKLEKCPLSWMPQGGDEDNDTEIKLTVEPNDLAGKAKFTLYDVSSEDGYCMNKPGKVPGEPNEDSSTWKDLQFDDSQTGFDVNGTNNDVSQTETDVNTASVKVLCYDYGAYGKVKAEVEIAGSWFIAKTSDANEFVRVPRDDNNNNIADAWAYNVGYADDDNDTSPDCNNHGDGLTRYEEYRGVDINDSNTIESNERLNPNKKDLFVQGQWFGPNSVPAFSPFAYGDAFKNAGIDVHEFAGTLGVHDPNNPEDRNIDVLIVYASNGKYGSASSDIWQVGPPAAGVRKWSWAVQGSSDTGNQTYYGSDPPGYTLVYKPAINNRFNQKPFVDANSWTAPGVWGDPNNGVLDPVSKVEDTNDNGVLDNNEQDANDTAPYDDGDEDFDGDYPVQSGGVWNFWKNLSPHDINRNGEIELPLAADVNSIVYEYEKADVVRHVITHEMGHSVGIENHCTSTTCVMYEIAINYERDGHFCNICRATIFIHND